MGKLKLAMPEAVQATYVIPTSAKPGDGKALVQKAVEKHLPGKIRDLTLRCVKSALMRVDVGPVKSFPEIPEDMLRIFGANDEQLKVVTSAKNYVVVHLFYAPGWPPAHEWAGRAAAASIAKDLDSVIIDVFTPRVLEIAEAMKTLPDEEGNTRLVDWLLVPQSAGDLGYWFTTKGLARYGLPELQSVDVPPQLTGPWTSVLCGIAQALLFEFVDLLPETDDPPPFIEMDEEIQLSEAHVAIAFGEEPQGNGGKAKIRVRFEEGDDGNEGFLTVLPPEGDARSDGEFMVGVCEALWGGLGSDIRKVSSGDDMVGAVETARAGLDGVRDRFLKGEIPGTARLMVKHGLEKDGEREFVWAFVTAWNDPQQLHGTCANNADLDSRIRIGRPVRVDLDTVIDWAIWIDGEGIIEGGWTDAVARR